MNNRVFIWSAFLLILAVLLGQWYTVTSDYMELNRSGRVEWRSSKILPMFSGSAILPLTSVESYTLFEPPANPDDFAKALGRIESLSTFMVFSHGVLAPVVSEAFGKIAINDVLDLNYDSVDDHLFGTFENVSDLRSLLIRDTSLTSKAFSLSGRFKSVEELTVNGDDFSAEVVRFASFLPSLKEFYFLAEASPEVDVAMKALQEKRPGIILEWNQMTRLPAAAPK